MGREAEMTITARYDSRCARCGGGIHIGEKIEWTKGTPATHTACPKAKTATPAHRAPAARQTEPALAAGEIDIHRPSVGREDGYVLGDVLHLVRCAPNGGGPDKRYYTVTWCGKRRITEGEDDCRAGEWECVGHVRPATDTECAPKVAAAAAKAEREEIRRALESATGERHDGPMPAAATTLVPRDHSRLCATGERVAVMDGTILHERVGDPDMCDSWYHYIVRISDATLATRVAAWIERSRS